MTRLEAIAYNALSDALSDVDRFVSLTERMKVSGAVLAAVREEIAKEILADVEPFFAARLGADMWEAAYRAASIARGER